jgi:hypothetical protein
MADLELSGTPRPLRRAGGLLDNLTPAGRGVLGLGVFALVVGPIAGYVEFVVLGTLCGVLLGFGVLLMRLPARVRAQLHLDRTVIVAGGSVGGRLVVTNLNPMPLATAAVEVPVTPRFTTGREGPRTVMARLPTLGRRRRGTARYRLTDLARGVHLVGPAKVRRTDPLRLVVRRIECTTSAEVYARPETIPLTELGEGSVSDLEGKPSDEISMSDLAFHALREYVVGDDLRHVHWRSSARTGELHVRQYHDTRRSQSTVLVDDTAAAYLRAAEFELALSIAGSLALRLGTDEDVALVYGTTRLEGPPGRILDGLCRAHTRQDGDLLTTAGRTARFALHTSRLFVITGQRADPKAVAHAARLFRADVRTIGLRAAIPRPEAVERWQLDAEHEARKRDRLAAQAGLLDVPELRALPKLVAIRARRPA